jgi:ribose transport system substrate-binding protein
MKTISKVKKPLLMATMLVLAISLAACGANNEGASSPAASDSPSAAATTSTSTPSGSAEGPPDIDFGLFCDDNCKDALQLEVPGSSIKGKVGVLVNALAYPYGAGEKNGAEEAQKKYFPNMELFIGDGDADAITQSKLIDDYIAKGIDVLVLDPVETNAMVPAAKRAEAAGIKVILMDRYLNGFEGVTLIKASDVEEGRVIGEHLAKLTNGKANIVELTGPPAASNVSDRSNGFKQAIEGYPDMKIISVNNAQFDPSVALKITQDLLNKYPKGEITALYSHSDHMTTAIAQAIVAAKRDEIIVVSIDGSQGIMEHIKS